MSKNWDITGNRADRYPVMIISHFREIPLAALQNSDLKEVERTVGDVPNRWVNSADGFSTVAV